MHQVGFITCMYRDARSTEHKILKRLSSQTEEGMIVIWNTEYPQEFNINSFLNFNHSARIKCLNDQMKLSAEK
jgi:hypothetical protein